MQRPQLLACLCTLLTVTAVTAQALGAVAGAMPMVPHPGMSGPSSSPATAPGAAPCGAMPARDPVTEGPQLAGKELAAAIAKVTALPWFDDLDEARLESAATGKPIFWLQALGEIDGFA